MNANIRAEPLKKWLTSIGSLADEFILNVSETGLLCEAVDPANVAMVRASLGGNAFESFDGDSHRLGIALEKMEETLSKAGSDELVSLTLDEETRKLTIEYGRLKRDMALIDPDAIRNEPDIPDLDETVSVSCPNSEFSTALWTCGLIGEHVNIEANAAAGTVRFHVSGDTDDVEHLIDSETLLDGSKITEDADSLYSLTYLEDIKRGLHGEEVEMELATEFPMILRSDIGDYGRATYMCAPRLAN